MQLEPNFLPAKLMDQCKALVKLTHKTSGMRDLTQRVAAADCLAAATQFSDTFTMLQTITTSFRLSIASWIGAIVLVALALFVKWWLILVAAILVAAAKWFEHRVRRGQMYLATIFLGLEVIATDFCGWGGAYPELKTRALEILNDDMARPKTTWLDFYLPRRANFSADTAKSFGPTG